MREEAERAAGGDRYREWGDLIYAYLWQINPGDTELIIDDQQRIPLDPQLSPKENAQAYFERYRRGRDAGEQLPERIAATETEIAYLDQLMLQVEQAETFPDIETLQIEWERYRTQAQPNARDRKPPRRSAPPRRLRPLIDDDGNAIFIGRSGSQNDEVTFSIAGPNDTWLHARGVPGSHVIVRWRNPNADERPETIEAAARIAAFYSSSRNSGQVEVDVARRRHVRKIKGAGPGMVTYRNERTIAVRPADEAALKNELTPASG
jgi:predicted ribosome quality control (RQC) complex YloA/Tae2 family protein